MLSTYIQGLKNKFTLDENTLNWEMFISTARINVIHGGKSDEMFNKLNYK